MVMNFSGQPYFAMILQRQTSTDRVKYLGQFNISGVEVSVLFLPLLLQQTPCQQSYVPYGSHIDSTVKVHVQDGFWDDLEELWLESCPKLNCQ